MLPLHNTLPKEPPHSSVPCSQKSSAPTTVSMPRQRGRLPRKGHNYGTKISMEGIIEATQHHISYTWNSTTLIGLEKYANCTPYGVSEALEKELLETEVRRLVDVASSSKPLLFGDNSHSNTAFASDFSAALEELACLADQIRCAMGIIRLDNARISMEHSTGLEESIHAFRQARRRLMGRFHTDQTEVRGSAPKVLDPPRRNTLLYRQLVEFVTAFVARLLIRTAVSDYWSQQTLSCLAACTVKIMILSRDTEKYANLSISTAEQALEEIKTRDTMNEIFRVKFRVNPDDVEKDVDTVDMETDASRFYYQEKTTFHHEIFWLIRQVLTNLLRQENRKSDTDSFEIFTCLYSARTDGLPTVLTSDRVGEISLSSDTLVVQNNHTAMTMLCEGLAVIKARHTREPLVQSNHPSEKDQRAQIKCQLVSCTNNPNPKAFDIKTSDIKDVISVLVPLAFCSVPAANTMMRLVAAVGIVGNEKDPLLRFEQPHRACQGHVLVTTAAWREKEAELARQDFRDIEIASLPEISAQFGEQVDTKGFKAGSPSSCNYPFKQTLPLIDSYRRQNAEMKGWVISESTITIKCVFYTRVAVAIAAVILCGGLSVPFTVQNKLPGVDPFNITLFAWLIAGLALIFAKGRFVSEWPWHEFIHGHVVCRTLKEVCDVSGLDSQVIIMYLLLNEWRTMLRTQGPFNGMFTRRVLEGSGFAINKPTHVSTMAASGFLLLKVLNVAGEHIVCLDARRGSDHISLRSSSKRILFRDLEEQDLEQELSIQLLNENEKSDIAKINPAKQLEHGIVRVDRVLGAYVGDSYFG